MVDRRTTATALFALLMLASPCRAASAEDEALASDLLVCSAKFMALDLFITGHHTEDASKAAHASWWAAEALAGTDFINREQARTASLAMDWLTAKDGPKPTMDAARATCLPLMKRAMVIVESKHPDEAH